MSSKKSFLMFGVLASFFLLASCKKNYTCSCTYTDTVPPTTTTQDYPLGKQTSDDAKGSCDTYQAQGKLAHDNASCSLK